MKPTLKFTVHHRPKIKTYDPANVVITFNGIEIKGFAGGAFVEVEADPQFQPVGRMVTYQRDPTQIVGILESAPAPEDLIPETPGTTMIVKSWVGEWDEK